MTSVAARVSRVTPQHRAAIRAERRYICGLSDAELRAEENRNRHELAACQDLDPASAEVCQVLAGGRLALVLQVQRQRTAKYVAGTGPNPADYFTSSWSSLADQVRQRADIVRIFIDGGCPIAPKGKEWAGPCFACGGKDRLVVFPDPDDRHDHPRAWCRQCGGYWDAIGCYRNVESPTREVGYYDAVRELAFVIGLPLPEERPGPRVVRGRTRRGGFVELMDGKVVAR